MSATALVAKTVLNVGCGPREPDKLPRVFRSPEWLEVRLDIDPDVAPDIVGSMIDMGAVPDATCDAIWSSHNLEHLQAFEVATALAEFRRVLRPDGLLLVTLPDMQAVARVIADGRPDAVLMRTRIGGRDGPPITALDIMFGHDWWIERGRSFMAHRTGFTAATLGRKLIAAGFGTVAVRPGPAYDLWAIASTRPMTADLGLLERAMGLAGPVPAGATTSR
ncbi:MAG: methyltransferase domain-containing protein [Betaproteobacteria bacterium]|nr:methyltransferase domain-containing protein [Betaproteobacteria bacterium]